MRRLLLFAGLAALALPVLGGQQQRPAIDDARGVAGTVGTPSTVTTGLTHWWDHTETGVNADRADLIGTADLAYSGAGDLTSIAAGIRGTGTETSASEGSYLVSGALAFVDDFSFSMWLRPAATTSESFFFDATGAGAGIEFDGFYTADVMEAVVFDPVSGDPIQFGTTTEYEVGKWGLVVFRYLASTKVWTVRWYGFATGNGTNYAAAAPLSGALTSPGSFTLGKDIHTIPALPVQTLGHDEMGFWTRYLTDAECDELASLRFYPFPAN